MPDNNPDDLHQLRTDIQRLRQELISLEWRLSQAERREKSPQGAPAPAPAPIHPPTKAPIEAPPIIAEPAVEANRRDLRETYRVVEIPDSPRGPAAESAPESIPAYLRNFKERAGGMHDAQGNPGLTASAADVEVLIGSTWFNRVGAVILLLGIGFFVKYSFDRGWISPPIRCCLGGATGLALVIAGEISLHRKLQQFAVGLLGAGTAVLYFSAFAAYNFYNLIPVQTAFALLSAVTLLSTILAVHGNILAIAILTLLGGVWTPVALSTGQNAQVALLTYVLILDIGFLISGAIRRWDALRVLTFLGTIALFLSWYQKFYAPAALWTTVAFILAFYVVYFIEAQFSIRRRSRDDGATLIIVYTLSTAAFFSSIYFLARETLHPWLGLFCVTTAAVQLTSAWFLRPLTEQIQRFREVQLIAGLILLAIAAPLQFDHFMVPVAWGLQAVVSLWFCRNHRRRWLRIKAGAILFAAVCHLLIFDYTDPRLTRHFFSIGDFYLNWLILLFVGLALTAYASAAILSVRCVLQESDAALIAALLAFGSLLILGITADQYQGYMATWCWLALTVAWYLVAPALPATSPVCVILVFAVELKFLFKDTLAAMMDKTWRNIDGIFANRLFLVGLAVIALGLLTYTLLRRARSTTGPWFAEPATVTAMLALTVVLMTWLPTFEIIRAFKFEEIRNRFRDPNLAMHVALSVFWGLAAITMLIVGFARLINVLRYMAIALFGITVVKVFIIDLSHLELIYRVVSFVALGVLLLLASLLYQKLAPRITPKPTYT